MATGTIIVISEGRQEEMSLISCATGARAEGLTVTNTEEALQPPFLVDHPFTFGLMMDGELAYTAKASYESWKQLQYLVNRGWSLIGNDLVILSGELKERDKLERVKNIWGLAQSFYSQEEVTEVKLWIVIFHHRHGESLFPVFQKEEPEEEQMIALARQDAYDPDEGREDEWLECSGPWKVPVVE